MNEREWIKGMDRGEATVEPPVDVANWVVRDLRRMRRPEERVLAIAAWMSAAAATVAIVAAVEAWNALQDPLANLVSSLTLVLQ